MLSPQLLELLRDWRQAARPLERIEPLCKLGNGSTRRRRPSLRAFETRRAVFLFLMNAAGPCFC